MNSKLYLLLNSGFFSLNKSSQEEVYRDFYHLVYGIAIYITKDYSAAEDIVQDAFIKTIYKAPPMETEQQLRAWIRVITQNLTFNILRKNKKVSNLEVTEIVNIGENNYVKTLEKEVELKILEEKINESLLEISPDHRNLIELKWKLEKSNKDIAVQQSSTEGAIKQKLHRAR